MKPNRPSKLQAHFRDAGLSEQACELLQQLLHLDPKKRCDARTAFGVRSALASWPCVHQHACSHSFRRLNQPLHAQNLCSNSETGRSHFCFCSTRLSMMRCIFERCYLTQVVLQKPQAYSGRLPAVWGKKSC